jgi:hypothetical protein
VPFVSWCHKKDNDGRRPSGNRFPRGKWHLSQGPGHKTACGLDPEQGIHEKYRTDPPEDGVANFCRNCERAVLAHIDP